MAYEPLQKLIDKRDSSEIIRDQIGLILVDEVANQMNLAAAGGKDPQDWNLKIFLERHNPIEEWLNIDPNGANDGRFSPVVNVSFEKSIVETDKSEYIKFQKFIGTFNIDVYAYGVAESTQGGHTPGDRESSFEVQRAVRLVRNIIMASTNLQLQIPTIVWDRVTKSITIQPIQPDAQHVNRITAARISLEVGYNEESPQYDGEPS